MSWVLLAIAFSIGLVAGVVGMSCAVVALLERDGSAWWGGA